MGRAAATLRCALRLLPDSFTLEAKKASMALEKSMGRSDTRCLVGAQASIHYCFEVIEAVGVRRLQARRRRCGPPAPESRMCADRCLDALM